MYAQLYVCMDGWRKENGPCPSLQQISDGMSGATDVDFPTSRRLTAIGKTLGSWSLPAVRYSCQTGLPTPTPHPSSQVGSYEEKRWASLGKSWRRASCRSMVRSCHTRLGRSTRYLMAQRPSDRVFPCRRTAVRGPTVHPRVQHGTMILCMTSPSCPRCPTGQDRDTAT